MQFFIKGVVATLCLTLFLSACASPQYRKSPRRSVSSVPTKVLYSYSITFQEPGGIDDISDHRVAALPAVQFTKLEPDGTIPAGTFDAITFQEGAEYLWPKFKSGEEFWAERASPGKYAFVRVFDPGQRDGQGLICVDKNGRPLDPTTVADVDFGEKVYLGHVDIVYSLTPVEDAHNVLEANFERLEVLNQSPRFEATRERLEKEFGNIRVAGSRPMTCRPHLFPQFVGRKNQCDGDMNDALENVEGVLLKNRSLVNIALERSVDKSKFAPRPMLNCPGWW